LKIWQLKSNLDGFETLQLVNADQDYDKYFKEKIYTNFLLINKWERVYVHTQDGEKYSDNPHFWAGAGIPVFSKKAIDALHELLRDNVELLPIIHNKYEYFIIHITNVLDAIDYSKAQLKRLKSGLIVGFEKYAFLGDKVKSDIFKVYLNDNIYPSCVFVTDKFREFVIKSSLAGFDFVEVWGDEK
jgi:hypothetical protein